MSVSCGPEPSGGDQLFDRPAVFGWHEASDPPTAIGDLDRLPAFDLAEVAAGVLAKLANPDRPHVLLVAQIAEVFAAWAV